MLLSMIIFMIVFFALSVVKLSRTKLWWARRCW
jgi:hypothetical protein